MIKVFAELWFRESSGYCPRCKHWVRVNVIDKNIAWMPGHSWVNGDCPPKYCLNFRYENK